MGLEMGGSFLKMIEERIGRRATTVLLILLYVAGLIWALTQIFGFVLPILRVSIAWLSGQGVSISTRGVVLNLIAALLSGVVFVPFVWIANRLIMRPIERRSDQRLQEANERFEASSKKTQEAWTEIKEKTFDQIAQLSQNQLALGESVALLRQTLQQYAERLTDLETRMNDPGKGEKR